MNTSRFERMFRYSLATALAVFCAAAQAQPAPKAAGEIEYARGAATAQFGQQAPRIIGEGQSFNTGDVLSTSSKSFAVIKLNDGSRLTLRPDTQFIVEDINAVQNRNANAVLRLFKGGVRAVTGFIGKSNRNGYKLHTPVATLGIRGTEFDARICEQQDCEEGDSATQTLSGARLVFGSGQLSAKTASGAQRPLESGASIDEGETVITGRDSVAVLVFPDNGRVTLQPTSELIISRYRFNSEQPGAGEAVLGLIRGGLRAVSGLIGRVKPDAVRFETPVATIGIRGTGFDLLCRGSCIENPMASLSIQPPDVVERLLGGLLRPAYAQALPANGMYAYVWSGSIELKMQGKTWPLQKNEAMFAMNKQQAPIKLPKPPEFMLKNPHPRPDKPAADPDKLFKKGAAKPGLYVSVYDGEVEVDKVSLKKGDASFTGKGDPTSKLKEVPEFIKKDPFPKPGEFDRKLHKLLNALDEPEKEFECEI